MTQNIQDRRPPQWFVDRVANPVVRRLAPTSWGRHLPVAVLSFTGRRSGRRIDVPVGVHPVGAQRLIFTGAPWRLNFRGGADAQLLSGGRPATVHVSLVEDPAEVGALFRAAFEVGITPARIAMRITPGHEPSDEDFAAQRSILLLD